MEFHKIPYVARALHDGVARNKFIDNFHSLSEANTVKAGALMQTMITCVNSLQSKMATLPLTNDEERAVYEDMEVDKVRLNSMVQQCAEYLQSQQHNMLSYVIWRCKAQRALGNQRSLERLRQIMAVCNNAVDRDECVEWMCQTYNLRTCEDCGGYEYSNHIIETYHEDSVCRWCVERNYRYSDRYDRYVHEDSARHAYDEDGDDIIIDENDDDFEYSERMDMWVHHDYTPPPPPIIGSYHGSKGEHRPIKDEWSYAKHRWFGVELEVEIKDHAIDANDKARMLNDLLNDGERGKRVFFERDGSLNNGFEIITQPMSLPAHRELWSWLRDRDACRHLLSHNTRTCGLHVHVNKDNLTQLQIAKIVTFVNDPNNEQLIRSIARRYAEGYCKIKQKEFSSAHQSNDRYEAVNITSQKTIEFRVFKGSLKYESVLAAIEFCNALVEFAASPITNDVTKLTTDHFIDFINNQGTEESSTLRPYINAVLQTA
jgi:hypothetical protein